MIKELIEQFEKKQIDAKQYGKKMFEIYEMLIECSDVLKNSKVEKIEILEDNVVFIIKKNNNYIKMKMYPLDSAAVPATIMSFGDYESEELDMVIKLLKMIDEDCVVFDVGSNLGWYTLNIFKDSPKRKLYAFEPIEDTYNKLVENLRINETENVFSFNIGFYNKNAELDFFYDITASGASSLVDLRQINTTKLVKCSFQKMDDFVESNHIDRLDFIKCDVEGAELFVYKGGINSIERYKPIIFSEMLRKWSAKFNYHPNDIIKLLKNIGYNCYIINKSKLKRIIKVNEATIETNYFFLHKDKHREIINNNKVVS